ncbi:AT-rich interactive domain-containing protein 2 isoform X2 [Chrysoperla carnea]|uniref:AT-rich interactive domain-containing protein 2 isoform X2 n=1 Tax=Chrysoperla carnea TaxID=189513 RepID=UPI001D08CD29|nr:AT-rich interactive domain-containing protein 2 isoform X2 [Chrysoperla carnea]
MAKILNKDPAQYACERDAFLRELQHFHDTRGTPFRRPPVIGEVPIDLYLLYNLVTARGGWVKITNKNEWNSLVEYFHLPAHCVNIGVALKHVYLRYLDRYEKVHYLGEVVDRASEEDDEHRHKRWSARAMHSVPLSYNYQQHNIAESMRSHNGLSADLYRPNDYERLLLCLLSPLPNEQDFAINTCTLLSNEGKHHLKLEKCPRLIDYLLAHAGVFNHHSLRPLFQHVYSKVRKQPLTSFWHDSIVHEQFVDLTNESKFIKRKTVLPVLNTFSKKDKNQTGIKKEETKTSSSSSPSSSGKKNAIINNEVQSNTSKSTQNDLSEASCSTSEIPSKDIISSVSDSGNRLSDDKNNENIDETVPSKPSSSKHSDVLAVQSSTIDTSDDDLFAPEECYEGKQKFKLKLEPGDRDLFCVGRTLGTQEYVGQRVLQIANILRNLSFTEDNITVLANNITFIRFLLLCTNSRWNTLHQYGFDMLSNVATEIALKDPIRDRLSECLLLTITQGLSCDDRFVVISALDVLNKLSQNEANEDVLLRYLERSVYEQVCTFLTIQDIMLLIYTLECLYALTSLGERACNHISKVTGIYDILVSLITVEAQSYGPKACIGMKVVETVPPGAATLAASQPPTTSIAITTSSVQTSLSTSISTSNSLANTMVTPALPMPSPNVATPIFTSISISSPIATPVATTVAPKTTTTNTVPSTNVRNTPTPTPLSSVPASSPPLLISQPPVSLPQPVAPQPQPAKIQIQPINHNVQQQHAHQQAIQENEQFALAWLRANFEPDLKGRIEQQELYRNYLNSCSKIGRKGVIAPLHFPRCVRSTFGGTVGPNLCKVDNQQYYEGIKIRAQPLTINCQTTVQQQTITLTQPSSPRPSTPKNTNRRNANTKIQNTTTQVVQPNVMSPTTSDSSATANDLMTTPPPSPASPILKAQLSAPFKKETTTVIKMEPAKSQVSAHPHLSQALLGASTGGTSTMASNGGNLNQLTNVVVTSKEPTINNTSNLPNSIPPNSSSLIKSLLATKVTNECMTMPMSMRTASVVTTECPSASHVVASVVNTQVTQRQQRMAQQNISSQPVIQSVKTVKYTKTSESPNNCRINGAQIKTELSDSVVTSSSHLIAPINPIEFGSPTVINARRNSQQVPPPLAPLSSGNVKHIKTSTSPRLDIEDSNSIGNISIASNSGLGNVQMNVIEDGDNSLTSFEGILLNGVPPTSIDIDASEDNSNISMVKPKTQSLMLADLLEKKIEKKDPPLMNGVLRIGDKGLELVENHIEKVLMSKESSIINKIQDNESKGVSVIVDSNELNRTAVLVTTTQQDLSMQVDSSNNIQSPLKRPATDEPEDVQVKRPHLSSVIVSNTSINGNVTTPVDNINTDTVDSSNGDDGEVGSVSSTAANLYAALAADVLDEEDMEEEIPQPTLPPQPAPIQQQPQAQFTQIMQNKIITSPSPTPQQPPQQLIVHTGNRQIIVSQPQVITSGGPPQMIFTAGGQFIQQGTAGTATIKTPQGHQMPVLVQTNQTLQNNQQRMVFSQMPQSVQFVGAQGNQYVISSGNASGQTTYVMAQPQTAIVQGQTQTVLVAQTTQQGTPSKTIIILQPQNSATHPQQKVVMTPQGQQMVMTQVARPVIQASTIVSSAPLMSSVNNQQPTVITTNVSSSNVVKNLQTSIGSVVSSVGQSTGVVNKTVVGGNATAFVQQQCPVSKVITCTKTTQNTQTISVVSATNTTNISTSTITTTIATNTNTMSDNKPTLVRTCAGVGVGKQTVKTGQNVPSPVDSIYVCEWKGCANKSGYKSANEVLLHAVDAHCPTGSEEIICMWERCDSMKRKRFSLMTHLIDRHCNPEAMRLSAMRRKQVTGRNDHPTVTAPHPGYAPDAALHAIKRHALEFVNPKELMDDNEGPVTKSIRLTASLILRNLVIYSNNSRRFLRHFEPHLANVAMSNVESSRTIAQILFDLNDYNSSSRR